MEARLANLEVFCSELAPNRAVVHARLPAGDAVSGLLLDGSVRGPKCSGGTTLPATYRLQRQGSGQPHAAAVVTEPIFWSPDWPALYDLRVELRRDARVIEQATRTIGLRPLAVVGKELTYGGKTWVLRGIQRHHVGQTEIAECHAASAALVAAADLLDEPVLKLASEEGVLIVAQLQGASPATQLARLAQAAAVAIAVLSPGMEPQRPTAAGNILLAHHLKQGEPEAPPDDARLVMGEVIDTTTFADWAQTIARPVIACRPPPHALGVVAARAECDRLQRDLAPYGQFAGYIV